MNLILPPRNGKRVTVKGEVRFMGGFPGNPGSRPSSCPNILLAPRPEERKQFPDGISDGAADPVPAVVLFPLRVHRRLSREVPRASRQNVLFH
jgi:hypothetical protein